MKYHKDNFQSSLPCHLINPAKSELGKISKSILENINQHLLKLLYVNQWKNSTSVIEWFKNIEDKKNCTFIKYDIREFYPSITETIFDKALLFAKQHHDISNDNTRLIKRCRKSLKFSNNGSMGKETNGKLLRCDNGKFSRCRGMRTCWYLHLTFLAKLINKKKLWSIWG